MKHLLRTIIIFSYCLIQYTSIAQQQNTIIVGGGMGVTSVKAPFIEVKNPGYSLHFYADIPATKFIYYTPSYHYWSVKKITVRGFPADGNLRNFEFTLLALKAKFPVLNFRPLMYGGLSYNQLLDGYNEQTARLAFDYGFGVEYYLTKSILIRANIHSQAITSGINFNRPINDSANSISYSINIGTVL